MKAIEDADQLPWLVMVHGMSQDHRVFSSQVEAFRKRFRILLIDLPGHGLSSAVDGPFGHLEFAEHVRESIRAAKIDHCHYWGTHTGATVGLLIAAQAPSLFNSLVLEGPAIPGRNPAVVIEILERARWTAQRSGVAAAIEEWWLNSCWFAGMREHPVSFRAKEHLAIVRDFGGRPWTDTLPAKPVMMIEDRMASIITPTLIYNGERDHCDFFAASDSISALLANGRRETIAGTSGFPAWENPAAVNALALNFFLDSAN